MPKSLTKPFLLILVFLILVGCYLIFRPFLTEILVAAIMASIFYTPFLRFAKFLKNRYNLAAILMCLLLVILIIIPFTRLVIYAGEKSIGAYATATEFFNEDDETVYFRAADRVAVSWVEGWEVVLPHEK